MPGWWRAAEYIMRSERPRVGQDRQDRWTTQGRARNCHVRLVKQGGQGEYGGQGEHGRAGREVRGLAGQVKSDGVGRAGSVVGGHQGWEGGEGWWFVDQGAGRARARWVGSTGQGRRDRTEGSTWSAWRGGRDGQGGLSG